MSVDKHVCAECPEDVERGGVFWDLDETLRSSEEPVWWLHEPKADISTEPTGSTTDLRGITS